ncbi:hypothetical protein GCM10010193_69280 [Kitasatospora atroaurantiaca]|uniref:DNA invertase Pin-like site-specific DNA recombinase n=1 Tax=Kitasatospora atroaurantiaca TaxID=285545 RepID=A0A561EN17_9ACTN|nr:recombinase family protein [Kitasatospora atroaurantiaca]TWE17018.1 DNA invertase Pin-like site-specific DNA recombinase [Kitasatospora atroaurantiaca]
MGNVIPLPRSEALSQLRAALYGRASHDPKKQGRSIRDQFTVGELECEDRGWTIHDYYEDRDLSASRKARKVRKNFERLVADMEAGLIDVVVYAERSRVSRTLEVSVKLRDVCERTGVLLCYDGRIYDMRVPSDRKEFTRDALQSEEEAEAIIARADRTARLNAKRGRPHGIVPFGYKRRYDPDDGHLVGQEEHPDHADVVRTAFDMIDQGKSLRATLRYVQTFRPTMTRAGLRVILTNRSYLGIRTNRGSEYKAVWPRIVDETVFHRVQLLLGDPDRNTNRDGGTSHMLSGIALCALCRADPSAKINKLRYVNGRQQRDRVVNGRTVKGTLLKPTYTCEYRGDVSISQEALDAYVEEAVLNWLSSPDAALVFRRTVVQATIAAERTKIAAMRTQLEEARAQATQFSPATGMPLLSVASLATLEQNLHPLIVAAENRLNAQLSVGDPLIDGLIGHPMEVLDLMWNAELDTEQRRHVIQRCVRVELRKAQKAGRYQLGLTGRVGLIFKGQPGFEEWPKAPALELVEAATE